MRSKRRSTLRPAQTGGSVKFMRVASKTRPVKSAFCAALVAVASLSLPGVALGRDQDDSDDPPAKDAWPPTIYLDLRTTYATIPADTLAIGLGNASLSARFPLLATLSKSRLAPGRPAPRIADALLAGKPEHRGRRSPDRGPQRPHLGLWRLQRQYLAHRHDRLVEFHGRCLAGRSSSRRLSAEWRIDPDDHAAIDGHEIGAGCAAGHDVPECDRRVRLRPEQGRNTRAACRRSIHQKSASTRRW